MTLSPTTDDMKLTQADYDNSLATNGRTFHWARHFLGKTHGANAAQLYAFCRLLDDLADGDLPFGKSRLQTISDDLTRFSLLKNTQANDPSMVQFAPFMLKMGLPVRALHHLIEGLLFDQGTVTLQSQKELVIYGYQVAGTVGLMMCPVLSCHHKLAHNFAIDLGIAMQLTNIARDVLEDAKMGRRYLPGDWVNNLTPAQIAAGAIAGDSTVISTVQKAIMRTLELAEDYYKSGLSGLPYLPKRAAIAIAVAGYSYRQIGVQLKANGIAWHEGRTVTSPMTKAVVSLNALAFVPPRRLPKTHNSSLHLALEGYAK